MTEELNTKSQNPVAPVLETQPAVQNATIQNNQNSKPANNNMRKYLFIGIALVVVAALFFLFTNNALFKPKQENTGTAQYQSGFPLDHVTIQMPNDEVVQRYPFIEFTIVGLNVWLNTFEGLVQLRGPNILEPGLAVSWTNPNPTTWIFKLRKGVHFQSGDLFTAKDVKYTIESCSANSTWVCNPMAQLISQVKIINDYTVELTTATPDTTLITYLYFIGMLSQAQVARDGINNAVGTGPYKIDYIKPRIAQLSAYDNYWGGVPKVKTIKYDVITDPNKAIASLENGTTDIIFLNDNKNHNDLLNKEFYQSTYNTSGVDYLTFDVNDLKSKKYVNTPNNPFHDQRVRQAIYLALNIPQLVKDANVDAQPVTQFATSDLIGFNPELQYPGQNLAKAKQLLAEAGFPKGFTVHFDSDNSIPHIKLANQIIKRLAQIGITAILDVPSTDAMDTIQATGDYSMMFYWYYPDTVDSHDLLDTLLHTPGASHGFANLSSISDPQIDAILDKVRDSNDTNYRIKLTQQAQALAMQKLYSIPIASENFEVFARNDVAFKESINMLTLGIDLSGRQQIQGN